MQRAVDQRTALIPQQLTRPILDTKTDTDTEVQRRLPEAAQPRRIRDSTETMGLLPQGPPDHPQKQRHGQLLNGAQDAIPDEGGNGHDAKRPGQRQQLPMHETVKS